MEGSLDKIMAGYRSTWYGRMGLWWAVREIIIEDIYYLLWSIIFDININSKKRKYHLKFVFKIIFNRWD